MTPRKWRVVSVFSGLLVFFFSSSLILTKHAHQLHAEVTDEVWTQLFAAKSLPVAYSESSPIEASGKGPSISSVSSTGVSSSKTSPERAALPTPVLSQSSANDTSLHPLDRIKVPHPIFVASLPKSGTTSTARYFHCGDIWTAHTFVNTNGTTHHPRKQMRVGHCMLENIQRGNPPLQDCGHYKVWSDAGHPRGTPCFYPSVHGLQEFYDAYPTATILLVTRNSTKWSQSMLRWKHGELVRKWRRCERFPGGKEVTENDLIDFYEWHQENIRNFTEHHPSMTYVHVSLEDERIGELLEQKIGIPADCFGHHNSHEKRMKLNPKFRRKFLAQQEKIQEEKEN